MSELATSRRLIHMFAVALVTAAMALAAVVSAPSAAAAPYCGIYWGSLGKSSASNTAITYVQNVRAGRHQCFDRMVVDIIGGTTNYNAQYVQTLVNPAGESVPLRGGAKLEVNVFSHTQDVFSGAPVFRPANPNELVNVSGFATFRQIKLVGPSFEGVTQIGLGVRARLPFRVFTLAGPGQGSRLVIDVAHYW
jgi:hypothetical protein